MVIRIRAVCEQENIRAAFRELKRLADPNRSDLEGQYNVNDEGYLASGFARAFKILHPELADQIDAIWTP